MNQELKGMRHAILMTAYKQPGLINRWIGRYGEVFDFYIHIDLKSPVRPEDITARDNVHVVKVYKTNWGGRNHLLAFLHLMRMAVRQGYDYYHTVSGQDWPVMARLDRLVPGKSHMQWGKLPLEGWKREGGGWKRVRYFRPYDRWDYKTHLGKFLIRWATRLQKWLHVRRGDFPLPLYGGSGYLSLTHEAASYVLCWSDAHPEFLGRFKHTFCSEELFFQTVLLNSPLRGKIVNDCLRYFVFPGPRVLDETDYGKVLSSGALFCRKVDEEKSGELVRMLEEGEGRSF